MLTSRGRRPYETSIVAFEADVVSGDIARGEMSRNKMDSWQDNMAKNNMRSKAGTGGAMSEILRDADRRAIGIDVSPKRQQLLDMVRLLHRKKQKVFDGLSPHRRETLRMIAEHMLQVNTDEHKH